MTVEWLFTFFTSLGVSILSMPIAIFAANRIGALDSPDPESRGESGRESKIHSTPVPRIGGIAMFLSVALALTLTVRSTALASVYLCSTLLFLIGLIDDFKPISAKIRITLQVVLVSILVISNNLYITNLNIFAMSLQIPSWLGIFFSLFIIVGSINAVNMIDGMDGLAGGISLISILMLSYIHFLQTEQTWLISLLSISVMGAVVGFLRFNSFPAKIFMGDGGSNWLGFIMGTMIVLTLGGFSLVEGEIQKVPQSTPISFISIILCVAVPAIDTFLVILKRLLNKRHPFSPDQGHFHHILLKLGLMEKRVVVTIYFIAFASATIGVLPIAYPQYKLFWIPYAYLAFLVFFMSLLKFGNDDTLRIIKKALTSRRQLIGKSRAATTFLRYWSTINRYCIYAIVAAGPFFSGVVRKDLATTAALIIPIVALTLFVKSRREDFLQVLIVTIGASIILVAINANALQVSLDNKIYNIQPFYNGIFIALGISSVLYFILTLNRHHLRIGPTDFLLLTIPLVMLLIPEPWRSEYRLATISARCLVLFAAMRTIAFGYHGVIRRLKLLVVIGLVYIAMNGLLGFKFIY